MRRDAVLAALSFICSIMCFISCGSDAPDRAEAGRGGEMTFEVAGESRAVTTSISEFTVYGDMRFQTDGGAPLVIFAKTPVVYRDGAWTYVGTQYWFPKHEHSFVAISPSGVLESGPEPVYAGSELSFAYAMPVYSGREMAGRQDKTDLADIVVATHRRMYNPGDVAGSVRLTFGHALSMINFAPRLADAALKESDFMRLHKLEISGFRNKATFTVAPAQRLSNTQTDDRVIEFSGHEGDDNLTIVFDDPKVVRNGESITLFDEEDALLMLPQAFPATSEAKVRLTYSFSDDPDYLRQGVIPLQGMRWTPGNKYTYNFTIDRVGLDVGNATIQPWLTETVDTEFKVE